VKLTRLLILQGYISGSPSTQPTPDNEITDSPTSSSLSKKAKVKKEPADSNEDDRYVDKPKPSSSLSKKEKAKEPKEQTDSSEDDLDKLARAMEKLGFCPPHKFRSTPTGTHIFCQYCGITKSLSD